MKQLLEDLRKNREKIDKAISLIQPHLTLEDEIVSVAQNTMNGISDTEAMFIIDEEQQDNVNMAVLILETIIKPIS